MLNLKKTAVAVLAFASSTAFAGTMGAVCAPDNVTVPCEKSAWSVGAKALYLQPTYSGVMSYLGAGVNTVGANNNILESDPKWSWGFQVEGAYHFNTGNDLNLNWYHLGGKSETNIIAPTTASIGGQPVVFGARTIDSKPRWDAVNLELGQHVDFGRVKDIRFHGGFQYARIKTDINSFVTAAGAPVASAAEIRYTGFGPRVGADMSYELGNGLGVYANAATALLAGNSRTETASATNNVLTDFSSIKSTVVVPEVEAKVGLNYNYSMAQGDLGLDIGYMWVNYFNAQQVDVFNASNFGLHGPFAGLKWVGNVI